MPFALLALSAFASAQSLTSDQPTYVPGTTAHLTGVGFSPDDDVSIAVLRLEGPQSLLPGHGPWSITADASGGFVTDWQVCEDCIGLPLIVTADGSAGGHGDLNLVTNNACGDGVVTSLVPVGASCVAFTPAVGAGPDNYEVVQGGTYTITISGVTECTGDTITVFIQSSDTGNFCFNAIGGSGTYVGTFTVPNPACNTMPISYKCGANAACTNPGSFGAQGLTSGCGGVHLRASTFDGSCNKTGDDSNCTSGDPACPCTLDCPQDVSIDCGDSTDPSNTGTPTGNCGTPSFTDDIEDGACAGSYVITRHWSAQDTCGGTSTCDQTITVTDTHAPDLVCPSGVALDCSDSTDPSSTGTATATDDCSGVANVDHEDEITPGECAGSYVIARTWTASDNCGNSTSCVQTITVTDTTAPVIHCPEDVTVTGCCVAAAIGQATADDDCSNVTITSDAPETFCLGDTVVTWTATDGCGNASSCQQTVTVEDVTLDFETDGGGGGLPAGQNLVTPGPEVAFSCPSLSSGPDTVTPGNGNGGAAIFDSTNGPFGGDPDLHVNLGNILIVQRNTSPSDAFTGVNGPDTWDHPNDDEDGGTLTFDFCGGIQALSVDLIDIDPGTEQAVRVLLTDASALTRTYTVPGGWTADGAYRNLLLNATGAQVGTTANATVVTDAGFDDADIVQIQVRFGSSGGLDNLRWCPSSPKAAVTARNGIGRNPNILTPDGLPVLGTTWSATLDCAGFGSGLAVISVKRLAIPGTMTLYGEELIDGELVDRVVRPYAQSTTHLGFDIPSDMALLGLEVHVQGTCQVTSASPTVRKAIRVRRQLSNALDLVLGF